mgnify:CR=1 FL=1
MHWTSCINFHLICEKYCSILQLNTLFQKKNLHWFEKQGVNTLCVLKSSRALMGKHSCYLMKFWSLTDLTLWKFVLYLYTYVTFYAPPCIWFLWGASSRTYLTSCWGPQSADYTSPLWLLVLTAAPSASCWRPKPLLSLVVTVQW